MSDDVREVALRARDAAWRANVVPAPSDTEEINRNSTELIHCPCGRSHPQVYAGSGSANDPIVLDPINHKYPSCPTVARRIAEAEHEHTLALIRKKIREKQRGEAVREHTLILIRKKIKKQQRGSSSGN